MNTISNTATNNAEDIAADSAANTAADTAAEAATDTAANTAMKTAADTAANTAANTRQEKKARAAGSYVRSGYLKSPFRLFYNSDRKKRSFILHYHDFHKLVIFLKGNVSYYIEGRLYDLEPFDVLTVGAGQVHRPVIHDDSEYERIIVYLDTAFFDGFDEGKEAALDLFTHEHGSPLLRFAGNELAALKSLFWQLKEAASDTKLCANLLRLNLVQSLMICLMRFGRGIVAAGESSSNPIILQVLSYISDNLTDSSLSIDSISSACHTGRSYLMHLFKAQTGSTVGNYITQKRLFEAKRRIDEGMSVAQAWEMSGFPSYSAFYYAYKKQFSPAPASPSSEHGPYNE